MTCVVLRSKEDIWYYEAQKAAIKRIYNEDLLVAGFDYAQAPVDIVLDPIPNYDQFPTALIEAVRQLMTMFPTDLLFFEGDMIPHRAIQTDRPFIREYGNRVWPSLLYSAEVSIDTTGPWTHPNQLEKAFEEYDRIPYTRLPPDNFEYIGEDAIFLHQQAGYRGRRGSERRERFKQFVTDFRL